MWVLGLLAKKAKAEKTTKQRERAHKLTCKNSKISWSTALMTKKTKRIR